MAKSLPITQAPLGTGRRGATLITGTILIGASGAVTSYVCEYMPSSGGAVKNAAAGRYDLLFIRKFKNLRVVGLSISGPATVAFGNTDGNAIQPRNAATAGFHATIQTFLASSGADTNTTSGNIVNFTFEGQDR